MKRTKLIGVRITPILIILNDENKVIGEEVAPTITIYPGNSFSMDELAKALEHEIPEKIDGPPSNTRTH